MNDTVAVAVIAALADPTRRALFEALVRLPQVVGDLAAAVPVSRPAVSQHLRVLREAGLVVERKMGRQVRYEASAEALAEAAGYLRAMAEAVDGVPVRGGGRAPRRAASGRAAASVVPSDDAIDAVIGHWAEGSLKFDPAVVAMIVRLRLVGGLLEERYGEVANRFNLNTGEAMVLGTLRRLDERPGMTPGELARESVIAPPSVAKYLSALERSGLIRREEHPSDRRSHRVRLTRKGRDVADAIVEVQLGRHYAVVFTLPESDWKAMDRVLRVLMRNLRRDGDR
jgi:DNA-binding transcriptional ArsR family regulator